MENITRIKIENFSLYDTLFCGQCFRFKKDGENGFFGMLQDHAVTLFQNGDIVTVLGHNGIVPEEIIASFFALDTDYTRIQGILSRDFTLQKIIEYSPGIRVLRQPLFETLISFILSQNNNISRITKIIDRLCSIFGERISDGAYTFPDSRVIASLSEDDLIPLRCGFRDKYILDAARKWESGEIDRDKILTAPHEQAMAELIKIRGVGPKVAACTLLFGASRYDSFPEDVWIKRAMKELFPEGLPSYALPYAGIAQQYIYYYARLNII